MSEQKNIVLGQVAYALRAHGDEGHFVGNWFCNECGFGGASRRVVQTREKALVIAEISAAIHHKFMHASRKVSGNERRVARSGFCQISVPLPQPLEVNEQWNRLNTEPALGREFDSFG